MAQEAVVHAIRESVRKTGRLVTKAPNRISHKPVDKVIFLPKCTLLFSACSAYTCMVADLFELLDSVALV